MKVVVDADTRTFVRFWLVPLGISLTGFALYSARTALIILGTAFFLALALNPPVTKIAKYLPGKSRAGGIALSFIFVIAFILTLMTVVVPPIVQQTSRFVETIPSVVDGLTEQYHGLDALIARYGLEAQVNQMLESIKSTATSWATGFSANIIGGVGSALSVVFMGFLVLVLSFLMLLEGPALLRKVWLLYQDQPRMTYHRQVVERMYRVVTGYVIGQLTVAAIGAVITGLIVFVISLVFAEIPGNLAVPSAAIYFLFTLIPMFGSTIAAILIALLLVLNSLVAALIFVAVYIIYQQIENNVISPLVQSKHMELSALWILAAVTVGIYVFGLAGAIISIPVAGCLKILFDEYVAFSKRKTARSEKRLPTIKLAKATKK